MAPADARLAHADHETFTARSASKQRDDRKLVLCAARRGRFVLLVKLIDDRDQEVFGRFSGNAGNGFAASNLLWEGF
jgi:hypothetical protein